MLLSIGILCIVVSFISLFLIEGTLDRIGFWIVGIIGASCIWISFLPDYSYKHGQIDCLNGKVKYRLEKQKDNTVEWVEIESKK